jgi:hypothetical protein
MPIMIFMTVYYKRVGKFLDSFAKQYFKTSLLALITGIIIFLSSCEGDPTIIGSKLLPPSDFFSIFSDTLTVRSYTMYNESIESDNPQTSYLGTMYDPYFGSDTAEFVSQIRMASSWAYETFTIDSIKLTLRLLTVSGNVSQPIKLKMSEIDKQIYTDSVYYSNQKVPVTGFSVTVDLPSGLRTDTINTVEVNLPVDFGNRITRDTSMLFHSNSVPDFRSYFKGILFQLVAEEPVLISLSVAPTSGNYYNYFNFFMHDKDGAALTEFTFVLDAVSRNAAFNRYIHNFNTANPATRIRHLNDTNVLDTASYVQVMNGVYTLMAIPGLKKFKEEHRLEKISVNKARVIVPIYYDHNLYKPSTIPSQAYMRYINGVGIKMVIPDFTVISSDFFDGTADTVANVYKFNIATYVQDYLKDDENILKPEVEIYIAPFSSNNIILKANRSHPRVRFEFTYTKF